MSLLQVFFFSFFLSFKKTSVALLKLWEVEDYTDLGTSCPRNLTITKDSDQGRTNFGPAQTKERPGHKALVVNEVVVGPFEEEEEGTSVTSDLVKVKGGDPATPGPLTQGMTLGP